METKSQNYPLIIDEKRNNILSALFAVAFDNPLGSIMFTQKADGLGITEQDVKDFVDDISYKEHMLKWCTDPNCSFPKDKLK